MLNIFNADLWSVLEYYSIIITFANNTVNEMQFPFI